MVEALARLWGRTCCSASACGLAAGALEAQLARLPNARASGISVREAVIIREMTLPVHRHLLSRRHLSHLDRINRATAVLTTALIFVLLINKPSFMSASHGWHLDWASP